MLLKNLSLIAAISLGISVVSCKLVGINCDCPEVLYDNVCVTGKYNDLDSVFLVREHGNRYFDTLTVSADTSQNGKLCFHERIGKQRVLVYRNQIRVDSSAWFEQGEKDCCHLKGAAITF